MMPLSLQIDDVNAHELVAKVMHCPARSGAQVKQGGACIAVTHLNMYSMLWSFVNNVDSPCAPIFELIFVAVLT